MLLSAGEELKQSFALDAEYKQTRGNINRFRAPHAILSLASIICLILTGAIFFNQDTQSPTFVGTVQQQAAHRILGRLKLLAPWPFPWPGHDKFHWGPCKGVSDRRFKCGYLDVPLDYTNKSDTRTIRLATNLYQPGPYKSKQTLITNPGGPGGSGTASLYTRGPYVSQNLTEGNIDILGFDPRGESSILSTFLSA